MFLLDPTALGVAGTRRPGQRSGQKSTDGPDRRNQENVMKTVQNVAAGAALTAALAGGGMYLAMAAPDGAATSTTQSVSHQKGSHQANGITEQLLTGDTAARVEAAAKAANPGATVVRVETDAEGAAYEAHIRKADGTPATVKLDASYNVTVTEADKRQ
jgi:uncharacterized membrane protein YkoI